jgi:hypothetical protein
MSKVELTKAGNPKLFHRKEIKAALMQAGYGQQEKGTRKQLAEDMGDKYTDGIYNIFVQAVNDIIPGFYDVMKQINGLWQYEWEEVSFHMPDGVKVTCKPTSSEWKDFKLFGKYPIKAKVSGVKKEEKALILYVTIIHACDAYMMRRLVLLAQKARYDFYGIHDGARQLPNNAFKTKQHYNQVLAEINDSNLLTDILSEITGLALEPIVGDLDSKEILKNKYSLS